MISPKHNIFQVSSKLIAVWFVKFFSPTYFYHLRINSINDFFFYIYTYSQHWQINISICAQKLSELGDNFAIDRQFIESNFLGEIRTDHWLKINWFESHRDRYRQFYWNRFNIFIFICFFFSSSLLFLLK